MNRFEEPWNLARVKLSVGFYSCDDLTPCFPEVLPDALQIPGFRDWRNHKLRKTTRIRPTGLLNDAWRLLMDTADVR